MQKQPMFEQWNIFRPDTPVKGFVVFTGTRCQEGMDRSPFYLSRHFIKHFAEVEINTYRRGL